MRTNSMSRAARRSLLALAVLVAAPARAQGPDDPFAAPAEAAPVPAGQPAPVQWVVELGGDFGSNKLYSRALTDGSTRSLNGNQGGFLAAGASFLPFQDGRLRTHATLGVKYAAMAASNGSISFYALPLEILETLDVRPVRLGAGIYALLAPNLSGTGAGSDATRNVDSNIGFAVRAELVVPHTEIGVGARYVWNKLSVGSGAKDAPAFGFVLSYGGASRVP